VEVGETLAPSLSNLTNATINGTLAPSSSPTTLDCTTLHYDCFGCIQNGCYWCPTDGLCFNTPEFVDPSPNKALLFPTRLHNCQTRESFTQTNCTRIENFFNDPVYSATNWIFSFVKVEPVWERGYFGKGVRVRVNDEGIEGNHPEFLGRIDLNHSCPNSTTESLDSNHGMTVASLLGAAGNNSRCCDFARGD
jgi:subtilisin family serine protease